MAKRDNKSFDILQITVAMKNKQIIRTKIKKSFRFKILRFWVLWFLNIYKPYNKKISIWVIYEKEATRLSITGPIMKDGRKSLITFGNARMIKGRKKKNKSLFIAQIISTKEYKRTERTPRILKPGYWNNGELNEIVIQMKLNIYIINKDIRVNGYKILAVIF